MTDFDSPADNDSATDDGSTTRRQVLAGAAGAVTVPAWASRSEAAAVAYDRNFNGERGGYQQSLTFGGVHMREDWWENIDVDIQAYTGDEDLGPGLVEMKIPLGPLTAQLSFSTEEARDMAQTLRDAAQDAEVMTHAQLKDHQENRP